MSARIATVFLRRITFGVYRRDTETPTTERRSIATGGEKISLFLEDWELARVALSCHMALDLLCQEMREAC